MLPARVHIPILALTLAGAFGQSAAHAQYGGLYGGGYGADFGGYNPGFDPSLMFGFGPDVGPTPGEPGKAPAPDPVAQRLALANHPAVQDELKLTDDQKTKLRDLAAPRPTAGARKPSPGSSRTARAATGSRQKQFDDLLDADQRTRLEQIALRLEGPLAVARPEVAKKIKLNAAQLKQVRSIISQARAQLAQLGPLEPPPSAEPPPDGEPGPADQPADPARFEQARQAAERLRQAAVTRVAKVLKPAQKETFNQLLGPPFDLARLGAAAAPATAPAPAAAGAAAGEGDGDDDASPAPRPKARPRPRPRGSRREPGGPNPSR